MFDQGGGPSCVESGPSVRHKRGTQNSKTEASGGEPLRRVPTEAREDAASRLVGGKSRGPLTVFHHGQDGVNQFRPQLELTPEARSSPRTEGLP